MITVQNKINLITHCLGSRYKISNDGNNINFACPVCIQKKKKKVTKKKLSIDLEKGIYHCWVCETKGSNIGRFCLKYGDNNEDAKKLYKLYSKGKEDKLNEVLREEKKPQLPEDFKLIFNLKNNKNYKKHYRYLANRGFDETKMKKFRIGVSSTYPFSDRVIFPSFDNNLEVNYYISRSIDPNESLRYRNYNGKRKSVIFRQCDIDFKKTLILTEGVFDLVNCGDNSTCILGSWISEEYSIFKEIVKNQTPVVLCFDPDAREKTFKIAKSLSEYCIDVKITDNLDKDFGDMSKKEVEYYIKTAKPYDNAHRITYLLSEIRSGSIF